VRSGERDGQVIGPPLPIHFPRNWQSRKLIHFVMKMWIMSLVPPFYKIGTLPTPR